MNADSKTDDLITRYLLGDASDEERESLEEKYFRDEELFARVAAVEESLIDSYLRGELTGADLRRFEERYLASREGRKRLQVSRVLLNRINSSPAFNERDATKERKPFFKRLAALFRSPVIALGTATVAAVVLLAFIFWPAYTNRDAAPDAAQQSAREDTRPAVEQGNVAAPQTRTDDTVASSEAQTPENDKKPNGDNRQAEPRNEGRAVASFVLMPGLTRAAGASREIVVPLNASVLNLQLVFDDDARRSYRAIIRTAEGREVLRREGLRARTSGQSHAVTLALPARSVVRGDYVILLAGRTSAGGYESVSEYYFRLAPQKR